MVQYIKQAMRLNIEEVKLPSRKTTRSTPPPQIPSDIVKLLKKDKTVFKNFESLSNSHKKEYIDWITEAKTDDTRQKRLSTAMTWIGEGKSRNWKYSKK
jgi:uncharacterized protein YdeI (YjbR/CyaY-like superfamily)